MRFSFNNPPAGKFLQKHLPGLFARTLFRVSRPAWTEKFHYALKRRPHPEDLDAAAGTGQSFLQPLIDVGTCPIFMAGSLMPPDGARKTG